ncbi:hypothetical protein UREG_02136 [Uncinocarpus reesii 1704]|uniref:NIMA interactive protein n=1 Tax=Uncinocarpus reesii (strain UAMH 1704) TaxID=336963 RepID=C4JKH9_UNCRE|nr:uncharacterized protein UREG_02136 [Uncinocarpus reesii 1704]EEP77287.1 hypothetical protein UREG_02136 [Uncinocarpus reesii 1704]
METHNLEAASDYINNLLLARGLLRNGKRIEFAEPARAPDGIGGTMTTVINLVHDLIMRRDREAEQHENLAGTIRSLRNTEAKQTLEVERLETRMEELSRALALTEGQERAFKVNIREAEGTIRILKEQVQRMKSTVQQIRAQYTTDIRKRDLEMQKLKARLTERTRGKRDGPGVTTITITPPPKATNQKSTEGGQGLDTPGYSLRQETTEFLTQLCQSLSDENDGLIRLAQDSITTLKELQGLTEPGVNEVSMAADAAELETDPLSGPVPPYETLSAEMSYVLEQLRSLLTNPSFVSLEEVEIRDSEISRLRDGWEKMEARWKEAVAMMDNWHRRMAGGGDGVNIDELKLGMTLGSSIDRDIVSQDASMPVSNNENVQLPSVGEEGEGESEDKQREERAAPRRRSSLRASPRRRTVRFAKRNQNILEECSGNKQPTILPQGTPAEAISENMPDTDKDASCAVEKPSTISSPRRPTRKQADPKVQLRVSSAVFRYGLCFNLQLTLAEQSNYDASSHWGETVGYKTGRSTLLQTSRQETEQYLQ